jgi:hypothetical protein
MALMNTCGFETWWYFLWSHMTCNYGRLIEVPGFRGSNAAKFSYIVMRAFIPQDCFLNGYNKDQEIIGLMTNMSARLVAAVNNILGNAMFTSYKTTIPALPKISGVTFDPESLPSIDAVLDNLFALFGASRFVNKGAGLFGMMEKFALCVNRAALRALMYEFGRYAAVWGESLLYLPYGPIVDNNGEMLINAELSAVSVPYECIFVALNVMMPNTEYEAEIELTATLEDLRRRRVLRKIEVVSGILSEIQHLRLHAVAAAYYTHVMLEARRRLSLLPSAYFPDDLELSRDIAIHLLKHFMEIPNMIEWLRLINPTTDDQDSLTIRRIWTPAELTAIIGKYVPGRGVAIRDGPGDVGTAGTRTFVSRYGLATLGQLGVHYRFVIFLGRDAEIMPIFDPAAPALNGDGRCNLCGLNVDEALCTEIDETFFEGLDFTRQWSRLEEAALAVPVIFTSRALVRFKELQVSETYSDIFKLYEGMFDPANSMDLNNLGGMKTQFVTRQGNVNILKLAEVSHPLFNIRNTTMQTLIGKLLDGYKAKMYLAPAISSLRAAYQAETVWSLTSVEVPHRLEVVPVKEVSTLAFKGTEGLVEELRMGVEALATESIQPKGAADPKWTGYFTN